MAKKGNLDYTYGETTNKVVNKINDDDGDDKNSDDLIIGSRKSSLIKTQKRKMKKLRGEIGLGLKLKKVSILDMRKYLKKN